MFSKSAVIMLAGKLGSGKSLAGKYLMDMIEELHLTGIIAPLAQPIKRIAAQYMGWDGKKDERGRKLLQTLGTEVGREYNENCWVSYLIDTYIPNLPVYPLDFVIIDDWRFPNEESYIRNNPLYEVYTIRLARDVEETNQHLSETSLPGDSRYYSYFIKNDFDKEYLKNELSLILNDILSKHPQY